MLRRLLHTELLFLDEGSFDLERSLGETELRELLAELDVFVDEGDVSRFVFDSSAGNLSRISRRESLAVGRFSHAGVSTKVGKRIMVAGTEAGTQPRYLQLEIKWRSGVFKTAVSASEVRLEYQQ